MREEPDWLAVCRGEAVRLARQIRDLDYALVVNRANSTS
jgi:hypothetical protein